MQTDLDKIRPAEPPYQTDELRVLVGNGLLDIAQATVQLITYSYLCLNVPSCLKTPGITEFKSEDERSLSKCRTYLSRSLLLVNHLPQLLTRIQYQDFSNLAHVLF